MDPDSVREHVVLDAHATDDFGNLFGQTTGDIDGDGNVEVFMAGDGGLRWYRPATAERGFIVEGGDYGVALETEDVDGDGNDELVTSVTGGEKPKIVWYEFDESLAGDWTEHVIDASGDGPTHDLAFVDLDGDGQRELIANALGGEQGLYTFRPGEDPTTSWTRHAIGTDAFAEGLAIADLNGDGRPEILHGPDWYVMPADGPYAGKWERHTYAPRFREMCRVGLMDVTGSGTLDVVTVESEYFEGRLSWFENRLGEAGEDWIEHELDDSLTYLHSLSARRNHDDTPTITAAEMAEGGWEADYNWQARHIEFRSFDDGGTWDRSVIDHGTGTHEAEFADVDGDGREEYVGKQVFEPIVHYWREREPSPIDAFEHRMLDRDKPHRSTDVVTADIDGDGRADVICGHWWYKNPSWERYELPERFEIHCGADLDGDGRTELIATKRDVTAGDRFVETLTSDLWLLNPVDPLAGEWETTHIGRGVGDWPHGSMIAPVGPGGQEALVVTYHSAHAADEAQYPQSFEIPADPTRSDWTDSTLAEIQYGEDVLAFDVTGTGVADVIAGTHWLENHGDGTFSAHRLVEDFNPTRLAVGDLTPSPSPNIVMGEQELGDETTPFSRLALFEIPAEPATSEWEMRIIDRVRCPHSVAVGDIDGDGEPEVVCGEHDPTAPYRSQSRLYAYDRADERGTAWARRTLDDRFEHHCGTELFEVEPGRPAIASHGWTDSRYVHLWSRS